MGISSLLRVESAPPLEKPRLMMNPSFIKKIYWILCWPLHVFIEAYHLHMPNKERAIVYGVLTIPIMWLGFSVWGYLVVLPHLIVDNFWLALIASAFCVVLGALLVMPIISIVCGFLLVAIAFPIVSLLPDRRSNV